MVKKRSSKLTGKKKLMIQSLITELGNITRSSKIAGIERNTHYEWLRSDPIYKKEYESIEDYQVDFYEDALHELIKKKNTTAIIFALKCKGKSRGWVERNEINLSGTMENKVKIDTLSDIWDKVKKENKNGDRK